MLVLVDFNKKTFIHQLFMATKKITDENFETDVLKASKANSSRFLGRVVRSL